MTAQASDSILYQGQSFAIAGISGKGLFEPAQHGFKPAAVCSFCWRGYLCCYAVEKDQLLLQELRVFFDSRQPESRPSVWEGVEPQFAAKHAPACYTGLARPVPFTGGLLLGKDFIEDLYVHMGFHPAWKFRTVHELIFQEGRLQKATDCSQAAEEFRKSITPADLGPANQQRIQDWIAQTFSLRYNRG